MNKMAKVSRFLAEYALLPKACIWIALVLWGTQFVGSMFHDMKKDFNRNWTLEDKVEREITVYVKSLYNSALKQGKAYGPREYFSDMKNIDQLTMNLNKKYSTSRSHVSTYLNEMSDMVRRNSIGKSHPDDDIVKYRDEYKIWLENEQSGRAEFKAQMKRMTWNEIFGNIFSWAMVLYQRGLVLVLLLYLTCMHERKGILQTILADKKRFAYSLLLWPYFILRYPSNVVQEIVVETEFRRMGNAFRRLSDAERKIVETVANSTGYREWIVTFRAANRVQMQRSFLCALLLVLVIHLFLPTISCAQQTDPTRAGPMLVMDSGHMQVASGYHQTNEVQAQVFQELQFVAIPVTFNVIIEESEAASFREKIFHYLMLLVFSIDHVPLPGCLAYREV